MPPATPAASAGMSIGGMSSVSELVPDQPIQERIELARIGPEIEHGDQWDQDQQEVKSVFGNFPRFGHSVGI
jgi:hypothetical protein